MAKLYIVATPIGNLEDISLRALRILKNVDLILCEDTRVSKKLLGSYQIDTPTLSYHQHSKINKINLILDKLDNGTNLALISDAGTPGISDPGNILVEKVVAKNHLVIPIPGPSAVIAALSVSGFPSDKFLFLGFIPKKKGKQKFLNNIKNQTLTVVFYESVYRVEKTLQQISEIMPDCELMLAKEITKQFETFFRGTAQQVLDQLQQSKIKGEFVVIVNK